jgi:hypothetical protein
MRRARKATPIAIGAVLILGLPVAAFGDSLVEEREDEARKPVRHRSAEILRDMDALDRERDERGSFRIRKRYGFEYARSFDTDDGPPLIFSIQGPALPRKRFGLSFEIRF